jgi:hypothetical protein
MMFKATIVSAFMCDIMPRPDRATDIYYNHSRPLLLSPAPKVLFLDAPMYNLVVEKNEYNPDNTILIQFNKDTMLWYDKKDTLTNEVITATPNKDTTEFLITMCNKTNWINEAILLNPFNTDQFLWIDFGINYIFKGTVSIDDVTKCITNMATKEYKFLRIGNILDLSLPLYNDNKKQLCWYFAGGVFGGNKDTLIFFNDLMKSHCDNMITSDNCLTWEVNIWYNIYCEVPFIFIPYKCDHDISILLNY